MTNGFSRAARQTDSRMDNDFVDRKCIFSLQSSYSCAAAALLFVDLADK